MERIYNEGISSDSSSYPDRHQYNSSSPVILDREIVNTAAGNQGNAGRNGVKYCGVCGDIAKSYHFGGLSCDSCKAFFRRSVQNDNYLHFQCCHRGLCVISLSNRKSCQYCRMKRCFGIGMEKSWVMTEEERKALMKARAEKKLNKKPPTTPTTTSSMTSPSAVNAHNQNSSSSSSGGEQSPALAGPSVGTNEYEPQIDRMIDYLAPLEIKEIESIVTKYMHAYQHVPYRTELRFYDHDRPGVQVMEMFGTLIRRFAFYARLMADFSSLPFQDQSLLLKGGVLEMCLLRGALVFDPQTNRWPNANMSMYKDAPVLKLDNIGHLTSTRLFQMHLDFIACIQQMSVDEPTIMLLVLIVLFTPERAGLVHTDWVEKYQAYYTSLLEHYMNWRFGAVRARFMFGKLLTKLSDLRELSDTHNHHNLRLGNDEVSSIQNQLNSMKLNPYPEMKVINESNEASSQSNVNQTNNSDNYPKEDSSSSTISAKEISSCLSEVELASASTTASYPPPEATVPTSSGYTPPLQPEIAGPRSGPTYGNYQNGQMNAGQLQQMQYLAQHQMPLQSQSASQLSSQMYGQQQQTSGMNVAMQFMQSMQQSVSQVVNAPHFGFEWVKPDYQFDPMTEFVDSELTGQENVKEQQPTNDVSIKSSVIQQLSSSSSSGSQQSLTEPEMDEIYEVYEGFGDRTGVIVSNERFVTTTNSHLYHQ